MRDSRKVLSYRVREYTESEYIVEEYTLCLQNELAFFQMTQKEGVLDSGVFLPASRHSISETIGRQASTVQFETRVWDKVGFRSYLERICDEHHYTHPTSYHIDRLNFFLATNYFWSKRRGIRYEGGAQSEELLVLNHLAYRYMQKHNAEVYALMVEFSEEISDDEALAYRMNRFLLDIGYIDESEYERASEENLQIRLFLRDNGFLDDPYEYLSEEDANGYIMQHVRRFLRHARHIIGEHQSRNYLAWKRAKLRFDREKVRTIECLNVGQANCSLGFGCPEEENPLAIFDLGVRNSSNRYYVTKKLRKATANGIVVISHYDADHIDGYQYLRERALDRIWVLPSKRLNSTKLEREFLWCIDSKNCVFLRNINYSREPFNPRDHVLEIGNIKIYQGNCKKKDKNQSTDENARSLMCVVENKNTILLPGDCLYKEFPTDFAVDYLVVPHHSCNYNQDITKVELARLKQLIVFAGPDSRYQHPDMSHIDKLQTGCCPVIYLMKNNDFYYKCKVEIHQPQINITQKSHIINL